MAKRRVLTRKQKAEVVLHQNGQCAECGGRLIPGNIHFDHIRERRMAVDEEDAQSREALSNFQAICEEPCHRAKTAEWSGIHAKALRQSRATGQQARRARAKAEGRYHGIQGGGFSKTHTRKFDGTVVRRDA